MFKHSHSIKAHYIISVLYRLHQNTVQYSLYDFKLAVISTSILLEVLSKYTRKLILQSVYACAEKKCTDMHAQRPWDRIDVTANLNLYKLLLLKTYGILWPQFKIEPCRQLCECSESVDTSLCIRTNSLCDFSKEMCAWNTSTYVRMYAAHLYGPVYLHLHELWGNLRGYVDHLRSHNRKSLPILWSSTNWRACLHRELM